MVNALRKTHTHAHTHTHRAFLWILNAGMSQDDAKIEYLAYLQRTFPQYGSTFFPVEVQLSLDRGAGIALIPRDSSVWITHCVFLHAATDT